MLYKTLVAAFVVSSGDALRIDGLNTRRAAVSAAASAVSLVPLAAFAELKKAGDADIYARADAGKLNAARTIERAKTGDLVDGSSANCEELDKLIAVDREAVEYEKEKLEALGGSNAAQKKTVQEVEDKLQAQINKLKVIRKDKGCKTAGANLKQAGDFDVYKRANEGKLVDGSGASCDELAKIINIDKKAVQFEKDKIEAQGAKADPADKKTVAEAEKAIEKQLTKLAALQKSKGC